MQGNRGVKPPEEGLRTPPIEAFPLRAIKGNANSAPRSAPSSSGERLRKIGAYTVQCANCFKFRSISTQEEFESIRQNFIENPWVCNRKANVSCDDPADLEYNNSAVWVIDKPNLPKTPAGCQRILIMRRDFSKLDATYVMPNGKRMRSTVDVEKFLEAYPEYKAQFSAPEFSFTVPKIMEATLSGKSQGKGSPSSSKGMKDSKMEV